MAPSTRRRLLLGIGAALGTATAGCLRAPRTEGGVSENGDAPSRSDSSTESQTVYPAVSDAAARQRALAAEETHLTERLQNAECLTDWGTTPTTTSEEATVVERTTEGVLVSVVHPFWYSKEWTEAGSKATYASEADGASQARYLVTEDEAQRLRGTQLTPC